MRHQKKLFSLDPKSAQLLDDILDNEGLTASAWLILMIRSWRMCEVFQDRFPALTQLNKAGVAAELAKKEILDIKETLK